MLPYISIKTKTEEVNINRGYTLVEILVTVAIIVVLVGISIPIMIRQINKGKEIEARTYMKHFETAMGLYLEDNHDMFPTKKSNWAPDFDTIRYIGATYDTFVMRALAGTPADSESHNNLRRKNYFDSKEGDWEDNGRNGIIRDNEGLVSYFNDPWGDGFNLYLDWSGDGYLDFTENGMGKKIQAGHPAIGTKPKRRFGLASRGSKGFWNEESLLSWN